MKKVLITGSSGMLGREIVMLLQSLKEDFQIFGVNHMPSYLLDPSQEFLGDLTESSFVEKVLKAVQPDTIIHCAAIVNVDFCENNNAYVDKLHLEATKALASYASDNFVYISTDSVFDGERGNYQETDRPNPLNYYAESKLGGEREALAHNPQTLVLRTNIFGTHQPPANSLFEWALKSLDNQESIKAFDDVFFNPVSTKTLAEIILKLLDKKITGLLNVASGEVMTKYAFILKIAEVFDFDAALITPISVDDFGFKAKRPKNMTLNIDKLRSILGEAPSIEQDLRDLKKREFPDE